MEYHMLNNVPFGQGNVAVELGIIKICLGSSVTKPGNMKILLDGVR